MDHRNVYIIKWKQWTQIQETVVKNMVWVLHLAQDSLHLNEEGNNFLVKHFVNFLNAYILWNQEACNSFRDTAHATCTENKETINSGNIENENSLNELRKLRLCNINKVILGNINSFPARFDQVNEKMLKNVDILVSISSKSVLWRRVYYAWWIW